MNHRKLLIVLLFLLLIAASNAYGGTYTPQTDDEWTTLADKLGDKLFCSILFNDKLPQDYVDFVTREALACRLRITYTTLEANEIGYTTIFRDYIFWGPKNIYMNNSWYSTWEVANLQIVLHELAHQGAGGTGNDAQGYDKTKEVNARKREAEYWRDIQPKPARGGQDPLATQCWLNYDLVFNSNGTQKSHDSIKQVLKGAGYWGFQM